jgi:hypothetical protein
MAALSVLAAIGVDASLAPPDSRGTARGRIALAILAGALALWLAAPYVVFKDRRAGLSQWWAAASREVASQGRVPGWPAALALLGASALLARRDLLRSRPGWLLWGALLVAPNASFGWKFNPARSPGGLGTTDLERTIVEAGDGQRLARVLGETPYYLPSNLPLVLGLYDVLGASAAVLQRYADLIEAVDPWAIGLQKYFFAFRSAKVAGGPLFDLLSIGWVFSDLPLDLPEAGLPVVSGVRAYRNPGALPRFRLVRQVESVGSTREATSRLLSPGFDPATRAVVTGPLPAGLAAVPGVPSPEAEDEVRVAYRAAQAIELETRTSRPGLLVTSEVFYPGWEVQVDGQSAEVLLVNAAFRGAVVPAGAHRVRFRFVPSSFYLGVALSLASLVGFILLLRPERAPGARSQQP